MMKEATGEFSMTTITIVAIILIAGIVAMLRQPIIDFIQDKWEQMSGEENVDWVDPQ